MTRLQDTVREGQLKALARMNQGPESPVALATLSIYDQIDALDKDGRDLVVLSCLAKIEALQDGDPEDPLLGMLTHTVVAVAGYAMQRNREEAGITVTGDRAVDDIFVAIKDAVTEGARVMNPDAMRVAEEGAATTQARINAGEDPATVYADELRKIKEWADSRKDGDDEETLAAKGEPSTGLYL